MSYAIGLMNASTQRGAAVARVSAFRARPSTAFLPDPLQLVRGHELKRLGNATSLRGVYIGL